MWDTDYCEQSGDAQLFIAALESFQTGKLTPLLKEELRCQIQSRRLSEGKDELVVSFDSDTKPPQALRPDEIERREKRKEQNRRAATKFRNKKKNETGSLVKVCSELEERNKELKETIAHLECQKACLQEKMVTVVAGRVCDCIGNR